MVMGLTVTVATILHDLRLLNSVAPNTFSSSCPNSPTILEIRVSATLTVSCTGYLSYYNSANLCRGWVGGWDLSEVRLPRKPLARFAPNSTNVLPEPVDVPYDLSLYGCIQLLELNDFRFVFPAIVLLTA